MFSFLRISPLLSFPNSHLSIVVYMGTGEGRERNE
jgi:hypothetical protein